MQLFRVLRPQRRADDPPRDGRDADVQARGVWTKPLRACLEALYKGARKGVVWTVMEEMWGMCLAGGAGEGCCWC